MSLRSLDDGRTDGKKTTESMKPRLSFSETVKSTTDPKDDDKQSRAVSGLVMEVSSLR